MQTGWSPIQVLMDLQKPLIDFQSAAKNLKLKKTVQIAEAISSNKVAVALSNEQRCCSFEYQVAVALSTDHMTGKVAARSEVMLRMPCQSLLNHGMITHPSTWCFGVTPEYAML